MRNNSAILTEEDFRDAAGEIKLTKCLLRAFQKEGLDLADDQSRNFSRVAKLGKTIVR